MPRPAAYITVKCPTHKIEMDVLMGADVPRITGGYGGWRTIDRPRKRGQIEYTGIDPLEIQFEIVLDAWGQDSVITNVDTMLSQIEQMTIPTGLNLPPPRVYLEGKAIPVAKTTPWVIMNITWGSTIRNTEGETMRMTAQITMIQADALEHPRLVPKPTQARNPRPPANTKQRTYRWKKGDTWPQVALKLLGDKTLAIKIITANKFRPGHKMKVGDKIKVPRVPDK